MSGAGRLEMNETVARLQDMVDRLEARVAALEGAAVVERAAAVQSSAALAHPAPEAGRPMPDSAVEDLRPSATRGLFLLGRSIVVLAGAFLLRALTEGGTLPPAAGFAAGSVFALLLLALADRSGARRDKAGAVAYGLTAALVAYPLLLETTGISTIVPVAGGAAALTALTVAGLLVAARQRLRILAWVFSLAALVTIVILKFALASPLLFAWLLLGLGLGTLLLAYTRGWRLERWLPALVVDALILRLVVLAADPGELAPGAAPLSRGAVMALALGLLLLYLGIFTFRTLIMGKGARVFYMVQSAAALLIGFGGAVRLAQAGTGSATLLGWLALAAAAGYYTVAFAVVRERHGRGQGFFYFASLGLALLALGSRVVADGPLLAWSWILLGTAAVLLGVRFDRMTLRAHSVVWLALAGLQTGLFAAAWDAFLGGAGATWRSVGVAGVATIFAAAGSYTAITLSQRGRTLDSALRVPRFCALLLALTGAGWAVIWILARTVGSPPPEASPAAIAVTRTAVLAVTAVVLAWESRRTGWSELAWPVYPLLALGLIKLLLEDLRRGTPLTLTVGFAFLGAALILAPRLLLSARGDRRSATAGEPAPDRL